MTSLKNNAETKKRFLCMLLLVVSAVLFVAFGCCICLFPKSVNWDSARGILAAKQYEVGIFPNIVTLATADSDNMDKQLLNQEAYRSPGYQAIPLLFRSFGLPWGMSVKLTMLLFLIMGFIAWWVCYGLILTNKHVVLFLTLIILCSPWMIKNINI
ncbi:MAG: hypothetical protein HN402_11875 [Candidatus Scalindua sp.]|jgi:hypothetical protein|nr:hypothetical protein [Candidatus Scalindua sp.]